MFITIMKQKEAYVVQCGSGVTFKEQFQKKFQFLFISLSEI